MRCLVTGAAGFIGSALTDRLLDAGHEVVALDDFSAGQPEFLAAAAARPAFRLLRASALDGEAVRRAAEGCGLVYHLAANADVRGGLLHPRRDLEQNVLATSSVLEAMRAAGAARIVLASSGAVYGEAAQVPTREDAPFPVQTSLYGASKLAAEGLLTAYAEGYGFEAWIFRLVSVLGERYSHGHVFDFYRRLRGGETQVEVLGDGRQRKSYVYVQDCVSALLLALEPSPARVTILNVGGPGTCTVEESLGWIGEALGVQPRPRPTGGDRGWPGDSPCVWLDTARLEARGWRPTVDIRESVRRTVRYLQANEWLLERR
ncbi:MAG TPA: NAD-dependent epimerase/dehydratase family protein [Vicinamibacteria bacterium]|nr:NAD-dependent epimerase/dehydratase family protein [Vicinamibacteria bacterium]